jgi:nucleotide-binding universal stress UspA family protein
MTSRRTILCPVDFSDDSRSAVRHAAAIAERFSADLVVLSVMDPLLAEAAELASAVDDLPAAIRTHLHDFYEETCAPAKPQCAVRFEIATGKPAVEILRTASVLSAALVVMGTHGLTGLRKQFFGSTTERVLRETTIPVLLAPAGGPGTTRFDDIRRTIRRMLVPVDLTPTTADLVRAAGRIAATLDVPVLLAHVVEPVRISLSGFPHLPNIDAERRFRADKALAETAAALPSQVRGEALVAYGDPAEEIAKVAHDRQTGLIVMALHASPLVGPRMGSVTYRVMCTTSALVLALPLEAFRAAEQASTRESVAKR